MTRKELSIEDIVEQIVGEIDDEHDSDEPPSIVRQPDNSFIADARASLDDVRSVIGEDFVTGEAGEEVETLGGYLVSFVGRLPVRGEVISGPGNYEDEVLDADPRRVKRVRITTRKERTAPRKERERRREQGPDSGNPQANDNMPGAMPGHMQHLERPYLHTSRFIGEINAHRAVHALGDTVDIQQMQERKIEADARARIKALRAEARAQLPALQAQRREAAQTLKRLTTAAEGSRRDIKQSADSLFADARATAASVIERFRRALAG